MKEPNFFIIGAPKCGTTSLARWLSLHPQVFMSPTKEPHHFSTDFPLSTWRERADYLELFAEAGPEHTAVGEASVWYLRSQEAVPRIESTVPDARYIVMLRNPVEMTPSLHWQTIFNGDENITTFADAWRIDGARENGKRIPARCRDPKLVQYRRTCKLGEQLSRLYKIVERDRVLTVFLEDMQADAHCEWARILAFLGVSYWSDLQFHPENLAKHWHWPWVRDLQRVYSQTRHRFNLPPLGWGVFAKLKSVAVKEAKRAALSPELRRELIDTYSSDIDLIAELTGRDLSHWKST